MPKTRKYYKIRRCGERFWCKLDKKKNLLVIKFNLPNLNVSFHIRTQTSIELNTFFLLKHC